MSTSFADWKTRQPSSGGYVGGNRSTASRVQVQATDKQVAFVVRLAAERDFLSLASPATATWSSSPAPARAA